VKMPRECRDVCCGSGAAISFYGAGSSFQARCNVGE
jgi:hypothetical protein